jgi:pyruvate kinase
LRNGPVDLVEGQDFRMDLSKTPGDSKRVNLPHPEIFEALEPGVNLLVNDGKIRLRVNACGPDFADCTVLVGGAISNRKGVNVPDVVLPLAALSEKDRKDLEFVCRLGIDWLALSFVQRAGRRDRSAQSGAGARGHPGQDRKTGCRQSL